MSGFERVVIAGAGAFGTALAVVADKAGRRVRLFARDVEQAKAIGTAREMLERVPVVVVTRGWKGALVLTRDATLDVPTLPRPEVDPTGAGDAFAGGFMGYLARTWAGGPLEGMTLRRAMIAGSTMASFCCEDFSLDRFRTLTLGEVEARFRAFRHLTHFDELAI